LTARSSTTGPLAFLLACLASAAFAKDPATLPVTWEGPEPLRTQLQKLLPAPTPDTGLSRRASLRPWVRDIRRRVPGIAAAEGYFSATVQVDLSEEENGGARVVVDAGPRTTVASIDIEFSGDITGTGEAREARRRRLRESWALKEGQPFRSADWEEAKRGLQERLVEEDYAGGEIASSEAEVDAEKAEARLRIKLESGPPYTFGEVSITGLSHYPLSVVSRVNDIKPGDPYRQDRLSALQRALQNGPWFASVVVDIEREPGRYENVPVKVTVIERPRMEIGLAAGYGTDAGVRGEVAFRHRNLFDRGFDLQSAIRADRKQQIGYVDVFLPQKLWPSWFGEVPTKDSVGVLAEHTDIEGLETRRLAVAGYRQFTIEPGELRVGLSYQVEKTSPEGAEGQIKRALAPVVAFTWRHVDDLFDPTRGAVLNLQLAAGNTAFLSTRDFVKTYAQCQVWIPLATNDQLLVRAEIGYTFAKTREGIPEDFLFRAGGARSVRGYAYQSLGAREGNAVVGGRYLATASVDYVHWFNPQWGGAVFTDVGDASDSNKDWNPNRDYGFGVRYKTPAGPLALDLAYAQRDRKVRVAFSVTVAF
jgi:translocation and assembly module TamA